MIIIDESEVKSLKLNINEYLTLLVINGTLNDFVYTSENLNKLLELGFLIKLPNQEIILSPKSINYFQSSELFDKFYLLFPHTVPGRLGEERPLRNESLNTKGALITKGIWKKKVKGNSELQQHIINVLQAEIDWRTVNNSLQYMNNIDTWLRQNNWEKYEYLLNKQIINNRI